MITNTLGFYTLNSNFVQNSVPLSSGRIYIGTDLYVGNNVYYNRNIICNGNSIMGYDANKNFIIENDSVYNNNYTDLCFNLHQNTIMSIQNADPNFGIPCLNLQNHVLTICGELIINDTASIMNAYITNACILNSSIMNACITNVSFYNGSFINLSGINFSCVNTEYLWPQFFILYM